MPSLFSQELKEGRPLPRIFLWTLLVVFNAILWLLLLAFHWEISLRSREVSYFGTQLFPTQAQPVPLPAIYSACALLTVASAGAILHDRSNQRARERIRTLVFQILDSLEIGVIVLDETGGLSLVNDSARRLLPEIPPGYASRDIFDLLHNRPILSQAVEASTKDGVYLNEVDHNLGTPANPWPARITTLPLKSRQRNPTGTLLLVRDVREVMRMERQVQTAERLSALGTLAAAMAHEIRNPLEALDLNLALLERSLSAFASERQAEDKTGKYFKILELEISRLAKIVDNFLSFARPSSDPTAQVRLDAILGQIADLLANQARSRNVALELSIEGSIVVAGSEDQLKQAFLNLAINSLEAMADGGTLSIHANVIGEEASTSGTRLATVRIQDTGVGIPPEQIPRLFDPYFTTRPGGTGLGLTIVHRVIQEHHGRIRVASAPGEGTTFTVELPQTEIPSQIEAIPHV